VEIARQMANSERAMNLLAKIAGPAVAKAKVETKEIQDLIDAQMVALN
jgi:peptidyl-dipeptidase Dcp